MEISFLFPVILAAVSGAAAFSLLFLLHRAYRDNRETGTRFRTVFAHSLTGVVFLDRHSWQVIEANAGFASALGWQPEEIAGKGLLDLLPLSRPEAEQELTRMLAGKRELSFRHRSGAAVPAEVCAAGIPCRGREALALFVRDRSEHQRLEGRLFFEANYDRLTGLPNRSLLADRLNLGLADAVRRQQRLAVALIDIDDFKTINDQLGPQMGDRLLVILAERLKKSCRQCDTLARFGADEFVHFCNGLRSAEDEIKVVNSLRKQLMEPVRLDNQEIFVHASIGISQFPEDGNSADELIRKADTARYHVKSRGKNGFAFYNAEMNRRQRERSAIEAQLRHAIAREELSLCYQPKVSLADRRISGVEALLRWHNAELGEISPSRFIPVAEETGGILELGEWALRTAARQVVAWMREGMAPLRLAVNLSARQLLQGDIVATVRQVLAQTGLDPDLLELELTESHLMRNLSASIQRMQELKALGITLSIDDFGTEYSSLNYVSQFPIDRMKIDRSFMENLLEEPRKEAVVRMIVAMAHSLGMKVIAEGVESSRQLHFLAGIGCEEAQGFYLCRPLPAEALAELLREGKGDFAAPQLLPVNRAPQYMEC